MNNKFYIYQRRDDPHCGYGMTGDIIIGGEDGFQILFCPDDGGLSFHAAERDIFGLRKDWKKRRVKWISSKRAVERTLVDRYGEGSIN